MKKGFCLQKNASEKQGIICMFNQDKTCSNPESGKCCSNTYKIAKALGIDPIQLRKKVLQQGELQNCECMELTQDSEYGFDDAGNSIVIGRTFEYIPNGTIDKYLHKKKVCKACQTANGRYVTEAEYQNAQLMNKLGFYMQKDGVMRPHPNCKCKWNIIKASIRAKTADFIFDGEKLSCFTDGGLSLDAASGEPQTREKEISVDYTTGEVVKEVEYIFDYTVARQKVPNKGPTPEGRYIIVSDRMRSSSTSPWSHIAKNYWWGSCSLELHPLAGTATHGRTGMFIHGGREWGSAGCIDLTSGDTAFRDFLEKNKIIWAYVTVKYSKQEVIKKGKRYVLSSPSIIR